MSDLIDKEKAIEDLQNGDPSELYDIEDIKYWLNSLPSAEKAQLSEEDATSELISRKALLKQIDIDSDGERGHYGDNWKFIDTIEAMPSAEPERKTGKWKRAYLDREAMGERPSIFYCSVCNQCIAYPVNYCPSCGADMRGGSDG